MRFDTHLFRTEAPASLPDQLTAITAQEDRRRAEMAAREESFQRCDTDGFLSQWSNGLEASKASEQADIYRNGGYARFSVLIETATGEIVSTERQTSTFGTFGATSTSWVLNRDQRRDYDRYAIPVGERSKIQKKLGLEEVYRWYPARAVFEGRGKGLSGTVWVTSEPLSIPEAQELAARHAATATLPQLASA